MGGRERERVRGREGRKRGGRRAGEGRREKEGEREIKKEEAETLRLQWCDQHLVSY